MGIVWMTSLLRNIYSCEKGSQDGSLLTVFHETINTVKSLFMDEFVRSYITEEIGFNSVYEGLLDSPFFCDQFAKPIIEKMLSLSILGCWPPKCISLLSGSPFDPSSQRSKQHFDNCSSCLKSLELVNPQILSFCFKLIGANMSKLSNSTFLSLIDHVCLLTQVTPSLNEVPEKIMSYVLKYFSSNVLQNNHGVEHSMLFSVLKRVASENIHYSDLKNLLPLLDTTELSSDLIDMLIAISSKHPRPNSFYHFSAEKESASYLNLDAFDVDSSWPISNAFTLNFWFCVNEKVKTTKKTNVRKGALFPKLSKFATSIDSFQFRSKTATIESNPLGNNNKDIQFKLVSFGCSTSPETSKLSLPSMSITLQNDTTLRYYSSPNDYVDFGSFLVEKNKWYCISLQHRALGKPNCKLYVNGVLQQEASVKFNRTTGVQAVNLRLGDDKSLHPFSFSICNVYCFNDLLSEKETFVLYSLGPKYYGSLSETTTSVKNPSLLTASTVWAMRKDWDTLMNMQDCSLSRVAPHVIFILDAANHRMLLSQQYKQVTENTKAEAAQGAGMLKSFFDKSFLLASKVLNLEKQVPQITYPEAPVKESLKKRRQTLPPSKMPTTNATLKTSFLKYFKQEVPNTLYTEVHLPNLPMNSSVTIAWKSDFQDLIFQFGGVSLVLYLIGENYQNQKQFAQLLDLLIHVIHNNPKQVMQLEAANGFAMLSSFVTKCDFQILSLLFELSGVKLMNSDSQSLEIEQPVIQNVRALEDLILNASLWSTLDQDILEALFTILLRLQLEPVCGTFNCLCMKRAGAVEEIIFFLTQQSVLKHSVVKLIVKVLSNLLHVICTFQVDKTNVMDSPVPSPKDVINVSLELNSQDIHKNPKCKSIYHKYDNREIVTMKLDESNVSLLIEFLLSTKEEPSGKRCQSHIRQAWNKENRRVLNRSSSAGNVKELLKKEKEAAMDFSDFVFEDKLAAPPYERKKLRTSRSDSFVDVKTPKLVKSPTFERESNTESNDKKKAPLLKNSKANLTASDLLSMSSKLEIKPLERSPPKTTPNSPTKKSPSGLTGDSFTPSLRFSAETPRRERSGASKLQVIPEGETPSFSGLQSVRKSTYARVRSVAKPLGPPDFSGIPTDTKGERKILLRMESLSLSADALVPDTSNDYLRLGLLKMLHEKYKLAHINNLTQLESVLKPSLLIQFANHNDASIRFIAVKILLLQLKSPTAYSQFLSDSGPVLLGNYLSSFEVNKELVSKLLEALFGASWRLSKSADWSQSADQLDHVLPGYLSPWVIQTLLVTFRACICEEDIKAPVLKILFHSFVHGTEQTKESFISQNGTALLLHLLTRELNHTVPRSVAKKMLSSRLKLYPFKPNFSLDPKLFESYGVYAFRRAEVEIILDFLCAIFKYNAFNKKERQSETFLIESGLVAFTKFKEVPSHTNIVLVLMRIFAHLLGSLIEGGKKAVVAIVRTLQLVTVYWTEYFDPLDKNLVQAGKRFVSVVFRAFAFAPRNEFVCLEVAKFVLNTISLKDYSNEIVERILHLLDDTSTLEPLLNCQVYSVPFSEPFIFYTSKILMDEISQDLKQVAWSLWNRMLTVKKSNPLNSPILHNNRVKELSESETNNPFHSVREGVSHFRFFDHDNDNREVVKQRVADRDESIVSEILTFVEASQLMAFSDAKEVLQKKFRQSSLETYGRYNYQKAVSKVHTEATTNQLEKKLSLEKKRLEHMRTNYLNTRTLITDWKVLTKKILHERGPFARNKATKWKLDGQEGPDRMRMRLKPVYHCPTSLPSVLWRKLVKAGNNATNGYIIISCSFSPHFLLIFSFYCSCFFGGRRANSLDIFEMYSCEALSHEGRRAGA